MYSHLSPQTIFKSLDRIISQFIWNKKSPRIKKDILQKPKAQGGLALPNFLLYYWAANIRAILYCCCTNNYPLSWLQIEEASCGSFSLVPLVSPVDCITLFIF